MLKFKPLLFSLVFLLFPLALFAEFPPFHFSADLSAYPKEISGQTVKEYVLFDTAGPDVTFAGTSKFNDRLRRRIEANRNAENVPKTVKPTFGYTLYSVNMKMLPSDMLLHKGDQRFDSNQYTRIPPSSPIAVLHRSADGQFSFVQSSSMRGWIPTVSIKMYGSDAFTQTLQSSFITITKDNLNIGGSIYNLGDRIPLRSSQNRNFLTVLMPSGGAVKIKASSGVTIGVEEYSPAKMKALAESLLGAKYDWGGKEGRRDCSAYVRDLWLVFGKELPRNTALQSGVGKVLSEAPKDKDTFYKILANAEPFKTLIFFKGHVMMYGGMEGTDYIIYHAVNRLTHDNGNIEEIGAVVKHKLFADKFSEIWTRVVKITALD